MPTAGSLRMKHNLSALILICLGLRSNGYTPAGITLSLQTEPEDTFPTTKYDQNDYTSSPNNDYTTPGNPENALTTTGLDESSSITSSDGIVRTENVPASVNVHGNDTTKTTALVTASMLNSTTSLNMLTTASVDSDVDVTRTRATSDETTAVKATKTPAVTYPMKGYDTTSSPKQTTMEVLLIESTSTTTMSSAVITPKIAADATTPNLLHDNDSKNDFADDDESVHIDLDNENKFRNNEVSHTAKAIEYNNIYENSPEYIQRRTINHAAVWITVGFVAILLTYILALFIHEKGRSEWRMATSQNYAQFENEDDDHSREESSITIDLDEPSPPFRDYSPEMIYSDATQNLMLHQTVIDTTKSH